MRIEDTFEPADVVFPMQLTKDTDVYREPGDSVYIVRFNSPIVDSATRIGKNVQVMGVSFRKDGANRFAFGYHQWCALEFEPTNEYDKNAIKVIGYWDNDENNDDPEHGHIGYIPKMKAKLWAGKRMIARVRTVFMPIAGRTVGIRIDVWEIDAKHNEPVKTGYIPAPPPNFEEDWLDAEK